MNNTTTLSSHAARRCPRPGLLTAMAVLWASSVLSGCVLTRVTTFKDQLCDHQSNFDLQVDESVRLSMHHPVLHSTDVTWLAGADPSEQQAAGDLLEMRYVVKKHLPMPDSSFDIPVDLRFRRMDGVYRLEQGRIGKDMRTLLDTAALSDSLRQGCGAQPNLLTRSLEIDLSSLDKSKLPSRDEIVDILGPPLTQSPNGEMIAYEYYLDSAHQESPPSRAVAWFDPSGHELRRISVSYLYYHLEADLLAAKAVLRVAL